MVNNPLRRSYFLGGLALGVPLGSHYVWKSAKQIRNLFGKGFYLCPIYVPFSSLFGCFLFTDYLGVKKSCFFITVPVFFVMLEGYIYSTTLFFWGLKEKVLWLKKEARKTGRLMWMYFSGPIFFPHQWRGIEQKKLRQNSMARCSEKWFSGCDPLLLWKFSLPQIHELIPWSLFWWRISDCIYIYIYTKIDRSKMHGIRIKFE